VRICACWTCSVGRVLISPRILRHSHFARQAYRGTPGVYLAKVFGVSDLLLHQSIGGRDEIIRTPFCFSDGLRRRRGFSAISDIARILCDIGPLFLSNPVYMLAVSLCIFLSFYSVPPRALAALIDFCQLVPCCMSATRTRCSVRKRSGGFLIFDCGIGPEGRSWPELASRY